MVKTSRKEVVVATKVTPEVAAIFGEIAERIGVSMYRLFELMIHSVIKYGDGAHAMDPILQEAVATFEGFIGWEHASNLASFGKKRIDKAIYMYGERNFVLYFFKELEKRGEFVAMADATKYPIDTTFNAVMILQTFIKTCFPLLAKDMDELCRREGMDSYYRWIMNMVSREMGDGDEIHKDIQEMFADNERAENGRQIKFRKYVAHNNINTLRNE
ncbi:MAG: hypothetical protein LUD72_11680 [Bacteroidales bacterium]|nr:hypothetical protein [Bacteroidales bacterium]